MECASTQYGAVHRVAGVMYGSKRLTTAMRDRWERSTRAINRENDNDERGVDCNHRLCMTCVDDNPKQCHRDPNADIHITRVLTTELPGNETPGINGTASQREEYEAIA